MKFKILVGIVLFMMFFLATAALATDCSELQPVIEKYYSSSQNENIDDYLSVMDLEYVNTIFENYEDFVKSAWEVYDTLDYELNMYNCKMDENDAILYFNVKSTVKTDEGSTELQRNNFAVFDNPNGEWKIKFIMDEEYFDKQIEDLYNYAFLESTDEIISSAITDANELIEYDEIFEDSQPIESTGSDSGINWFWISLIILFVLIVFMIIKHLPKKKNSGTKDNVLIGRLVEKIQSIWSGAKSITLKYLPLFWKWIKKTTKKYAPIIWAFVKKCCIALGKYSLKLAHEIKLVIKKKSKHGKSSKKKP